MERRRTYAMELSPESVSRLALGGSETLSAQTIESLLSIWDLLLEEHPVAITDVTGLITGVRYRRFAVKGLNYSVIDIVSDEAAWKQLVTSPEYKSFQGILESSIAAVMAGVPVSDVIV